MSTRTHSGGSGDNGSGSGSSRRSSRAVLHWVGVHSLGVAAALFFVLPFVFLLLTSLMGDRQALTRDLWPHTWEWGNYAKVWHTPGFLTWWRNTLLYAGLGTLLTVVSSVPVAYALAKFRFRGGGSRCCS